MSDEITTPLNNDQNRNFRSFFYNNKKSFVSIILIFFFILFAYFFYDDYKKNNKTEISEKYNSAIISFNKNDSSQSIIEMKNIIESHDPTYSPLALYFLLDNNLLDKKDEINQYFDNLIYKTKLPSEVKNLIIFKKGLFNSEEASEEELLNIFSPLINTDNLWKSHAMYIIAEYFFSKNEKQKSKEFFEKILEMENSNPQIKLEAQKRLQRDFGV
tara:strand:+ start:1872 stop:2516 length:645 start_codon:yes stop_codon:yes gene_type:complete